MISVVIPTMWRHEPFCDFLSQVCAHAHVQDVILIDNAHEHRPTHVALAHDKITWICLGENLFVNPSWNMGVYHSKAPIICLQNDDISFDCTIYERVDNFMQPHMGLVSLSSQTKWSDQIEFKLWQGESQFGCGQLMFFNRHAFCHIDPELQVYCGDNWLFDHMWHVSQHNYMIHNLNYHTPYAQTSKHYRHMLESEQAAYDAICKKQHITPLHV